MASTSRLRRLVWPVSMRQILASDHSSFLHELWFFGGTTEIQKEIIARSLGL